MTSLAKLQQTLRNLLGIERTDSQRITALEAKVKQMSQAMTDLTNAINAYQAEVTADVGELLTQVKTLNTTLADLKAAPAVTAEDSAGLEALAASLNDAAAALHAKVQVPIVPATPSTP